MSSSKNIRGQQPLALRQTNVSNPSFVVGRRNSQQSLTASEDYYSLSETSSQSTILPAVTNPAIRRESTPPSQYRTPLESRELLVQHASSGGLNRDTTRGLEYKREGGTEQSTQPMSNRGSPGVMPQGTHPGNIRYTPVPGTAMEPHYDAAAAAEWPLLGKQMPSTHAESSVTRGFAVDNSPPTPGMDDAPFIRFALEQLTRDEEVRGSRSYPGASEGPATAERQILPPQSRYSTYPHQRQPSQVPATSASAAWPGRSTTRDSIEPPPRNPNRPISRDHRDLGRPVAPPIVTNAPEPNVFLPVTSSSRRHPSLNFRPGALRAPALGLFLSIVLAYIACLIFCAVWSLTNSGLWRYSAFGDGRYFIFQYLPNILGVLIFCWLVHLETAVYRIAPYIALSSSSVNHRHRAVRLPLVPRGFVLPYLGHFRAGQPLVGIFMFVAWLQLFTIPLLASSFNVHFYDDVDGGSWVWVATQGAIWTAIGLYALLFLSGLALLIWIRRATTGLKWDPRSLADNIVLIERSNALGGSRTDEHIAQLGYWRTSARPHEIFHTYGVANKAPRQYAVEDGRIREKSSLMYLRFSSDEVDPEKGSTRHSRERMLGDNPRQSLLGASATAALPWFLQPSFALLWQIAAIVLLAAFLVVSYLPATRVSDGFKPGVPAAVNTIGFSATNFLYSFLPSLLAMLCLLIWLDIDYAYRRLQPFASLNTSDGELAERSLLLSYVADLPIFVTLSALANGHLRVALLSFMSTFIAPVLAIIGGGVFWAQFYVASQTVRISAHMPAYYALTAFVTIYALSYLFIFPSRAHQHLYLPPSHITTGKPDINTFAALLTLLHQTKLLDDVAFHAPVSKTALVTRLLSANPGAHAPVSRGIGASSPAGASKVSLADSVRGFANARQQAHRGVSVVGIPRYTLGRYIGRDGRDYFGIDRF